MINISSFFFNQVFLTLNDKIIRDIKKGLHL